MRIRIHIPASTRGTNTRECLTWLLLSVLGRLLLLRRVLAAAPGPVAVVSVIAVLLPLQTVQHQSACKYMAHIKNTGTQTVVQESNTDSVGTGTGTVHTRLLKWWAGADLGGERRGRAQPPTPWRLPKLAHKLDFEFCRQYIQPRL